MLLYIFDSEYSNIEIILIENIHVLKKICFYGYTEGTLHTVPFLFYLHIFAQFLNIHELNWFSYTFFLLSWFLDMAVCPCWATVAVHRL